MALNKSLKTEYSVEKKNKVFFTGHQLQITKDSKYIFCQCSDAVNIVELSTGSIISSISSEEDEIVTICLAPNNQSLAIGYQSSSLKHYNVENVLAPKLLTSFNSYHRGPVTSLCWDSSSTLLATGGSDGSARVWDLKQKFCTHSLKGAQGVFKILLFDTDLIDRQWIFGTAEEKIYIWQLMAGDSKLLSCLNEHTSAITGIQLTHDRTKLISCGLDKVLILWNLENFVKLKIVPVLEPLSGIILQPNGSDFCGLSADNCKDCVLTIGNRGTLSIWNVENSKECWRSEQRCITAAEKEVLLVNHLLYLPLEESVMLAAYDHTIVFYSLRTKEIWKQLSGYNDDIIDAIFVGENSHLVVATNSPLIRIYDNENLSCKFVTGHSSNILGLAKHPTMNSIFASCAHDNIAKLWKLTETGSATCLAMASGHTHSVGSVVLTPDYMITGSKDTCIKKWPLNSQELLSKNELKLYSSRTHKAHDKDINCIAVSRKYLYIATASQDKTAKIYNAENLEELGVLRGHKKSLWCVQFSPTDRVVATASSDGTIKIWTLASYSIMSTLEGHDVAVLRVTWISNGLQLLSTAADGLVKLWTTRDHLCVNTFDEHDSHIWALAVTQNEEKMVTAGSDSTIVWWKNVTEEQRIKKHQQAKDIVEQEQTMMNFIEKRKWKKALRYAIRLNQPFRALTTMKQLLDENPEELGSVLEQLKQEEISSLLEFVVQWNTKTRNAREAQQVLNYLLKSRYPEEIEALPDWKTILEGCLPYTERHMKRLAALVQSSTIFNYFVAVASIEPQDEQKNFIEQIEDDKELLTAIPQLKLNDSVEVKMKDSDEESDSSDQDDDAIMVPESIEDTRGNYIMERISLQETAQDSDNGNVDNEQQMSDDEQK